MGAPAGFENTLLRGAWSKDDGGKRVGVGGADRTVCIWDVDSGKVLYKVRTSISFVVSKLSVLFSYLVIRERSLLLTSTPKNLSVRHTPVHLHRGMLTMIFVIVLTGSKDATMLLGEIEPTLTV